MEGRVFAALGLAFLLAACVGSEGSEQENGAGVCAAGSTARFQEAQEEAPFAVYCPSYLPDGFRLESVAFGTEKFAPGVTPPPSVGQVTAVFVDSASGARLRFVQGLLGASFEFHLGEPYEGQPTDEVAYGDFPASLYPPCNNPELGPQPAIVFGHSPDERQHFIDGVRVDAASMKRVAEGMARVGPFGTPLGEETSEFVPPEGNAGPLGLHLDCDGGPVVPRWDDAGDEAGYTVERSWMLYLESDV